MPPVFSFPRTTVLECGASRTALGVFTRRGRLRLEYFAAETLPVTAGGEDDWLENTRSALLTLRRRVKVSGPVVLVLPAHLVLTKFLQVPRVEAAQRERIIRFEAGQSIPCAPADAVWDTVVAGERTGHLDVLLAAAKVGAVDPLCTAVQAAGFRPRLVLPAPLATLAAFRLAIPAPAGPSLVLNLGARSTAVLLVEPARFALRSIPLGGHGVTRQIAAVRGCDAKEAEAIKLSACDSRLTAGALETLATRLAQETARTVLHFRRQCGMGQPVRVHLTGGGARLAGLGGALATRLGLPVDHLDASGAIGPAGSTPRDAAGGQATMLADLIGAAATQLQPDQPVLNLLPPQLRRQENLRRRRPWLAAAAVFAAAALLAPGLHYRRVRDEAQGRTAAIERELAPLRARDARIRADLQQLAELRERVTALQGVHDRRAGWLNLLADLQDRLVRAEDVWLEKLQVAPAADGAPLRLHLTGRMLDQTNPLSRGSPETTRRIKSLLRDIAASPLVRVAEEGQHFDHSRPGILKFDFVLTANPARPL